MQEESIGQPGRVEPSRRKGVGVGFDEGFFDVFEELSVADWHQTQLYMRALAAQFLSAMSGLSPYGCRLRKGCALK